MSDESGFEVAAAYVTVTPDLSDFAQALDEEAGGLTIAVRVMPDVSGLQAAVDEENITADVRLVANPSGFEDQVDEQLAGFTATVAVGADTAPAQGEVRGLLDEIDAARGDLFVGADTGAARQQAESLAEQFSGLSGDLTFGADTGSASAGVEHLTGDLDALAGAASFASGALGGAGGGIAALESHAETAASALSGLTGVLAGGLAGVAAVEVVPEISGDFEQQVHEETSGLTAAARLIPEASGFQDQVDEQLAGLTATVMVHADLGQAEADVREFASGTVPAFAEVQEAAGAAGAALDDYWSQPRVMTGVPSAMQASIDAFNGAGAAADEAKASIEADFEGLEDTAVQLGEAITELDSKFLQMANAQFGPGTDAELEDMTSRFEILYRTLGSVDEELLSLREDFEAAGGDFTGLDEGLGNTDSALRSISGNLAAAEEALGTLAGDFFDVQEQAQRLGVTVDELPAKLDTVFAGYIARADEAKASLAALNADTAGAVAGVAENAEVAEEKVGVLGGAMGTLGERFSYMASDPFMLAMSIPMAVEGVSSAVSTLNTDANSIVASLQEVDDATGYNIAGYRELASQISSTSGTMNAASKATAVGDFLGVGGGASSAISWIGKLRNAVDTVSGNIFMEEAEPDTGAQQQGQAAAAEADNLSSHLRSLESQYGLTQSQAQALATAAGESATQLGSSGNAANQAMGKIEAYANANIGAQGPVGELNSDMSTWSNTTLTATSRISALDDAYGLLVGNFVGTQQDALSVAQGWDTLASDADQAGASMTGTNSASVALQQAFYSQVGAIDTTVDAMQKQGDSTQEVTSYLDDQIGKLSGWAQGNAGAEYAVSQLRDMEDHMTDSTKQATEAVDHAATEIAGQFTTQVQQAGAKSQATAGYIDGLKTSILDTGTTSQQTANLRAELITSLENAGLKAKTAATDVDGFINRIAGIPKTTDWTLIERATGTWSEQQVQSMITLPGTSAAGLGVTIPGRAGGGLVLGGSGNPKADDIPSLLSNREYVVQADAVDKYGTGLLDAINAKRFAEGGLASADGSYSGTATGLGTWTQGRYDITENAMANLLAGTASAASASQGGTFAGALGGAAGSVQALAEKAAAARGWTGAQWDALNAVEMTEAGWNLAAVNPGSGAYGIAQFTGGAPEYALYGGNAGTAAGQVTAFENYVEQRYGNPEAAYQHEMQYHWYANGGRLNPGQSAVVGEAGLPEVVTAGMAGATVTPMGRGGNTVNVYFTGMQYPSAEQVANLKSELAFALVGAP